MKSFIICMFATFATVTSFAQKSKQDQAPISTDTSTTTVYYCTMHPDYISFAQENVLFVVRIYQRKK